MCPPWSCIRLANRRTPTELLPPFLLRPRSPSRARAPLRLTGRRQQPSPEGLAGGQHRVAGRSRSTTRYGVCKTVQHGGSRCARALGRPLSGRGVGRNASLGVECAPREGAPRRSREGLYVPPPPAPQGSDPAVSSCAGIVRGQEPRPPKSGGDGQEPTPYLLGGCRLMMVAVGYASRSLNQSVTRSGSRASTPRRAGLEFTNCACADPSTGMNSRATQTPQAATRETFMVTTSFWTNPSQIQRCNHVAFSRDRRRPGDPAMCGRHFMRVVREGYPSRWGPAGALRIGPSPTASPGDAPRQSIPDLVGARLAAGHGPPGTPPHEHLPGTPPHGGSSATATLRFAAPNADIPERAGLRHDQLVFEPLMAPRASVPRARRRPRAGARLLRRGVGNSSSVSRRRCRSAAA
jgi:hypothetical protein